MDPKRVLFEIASLLFLPFGINLCSGFSKKIIIPIQLLFFASYVSNMIIVGIKMIATFKSKYLVILPANWIINNILTVVTIFRLRNKVMELMERMVNHMPEDIIQTQSRRAVRYIIGAIFYIILLSLLDFIDTPWTSFSLIASNLYIILTFSWHRFFVSISITFYFLQYDILNTHIFHVLQCLKKSVKEKDTMNFRRLYAVILVLLDTTDTFDENMCAFPFLWFSTTFFSGAVNVFRAKQLTDKDTINVIEFFVHPVCTNGLLFLVIWLLDKKHCEQQRLVQKLISQLVLKESDTDILLRMSTVGALETLGNKKMTVLKFLNLDRQLLLAFTSSFVTFNALFISFV